MGRFLEYHENFYVLMRLHILVWDIDLKCFCGTQHDVQSSVQKQRQLPNIKIATKT